VCSTRRASAVMGIDSTSKLQKVGKSISELPFNLRRGDMKIGLTQEKIHRKAKSMESAESFGQDINLTWANLDALLV
jgi:hypothetical protein